MWFLALTTRDYLKCPRPRKKVLLLYSSCTTSGCPFGGVYPAEEQELIIIPENPRFFCFFCFFVFGVHVHVHVVITVFYHINTTKCTINKRSNRTNLYFTYRLTMLVTQLFNCHLLCSLNISQRKRLYLS